MSTAVEGLTDKHTYIHTNIWTSRAAVAAKGTVKLIVEGDKQACLVTPLHPYVHHVHHAHHVHHHAQTW